MPDHENRWGLLLLLGVILTLMSCASTPLNRLTQPTTSLEAQVYLRPTFISHQRTRLVIDPFTPPSYAPGTGHVVTHEFYQELLRSGLYRQIALSSQIPNDSSMASIRTELNDFDLAMRGKIVHLLAGSGNAPSQLTLEIQVVSVSAGTIVWFVRLDATSEPGADIDLVWHTLEGQGSQPYQILARALAQRLVKVMTPPSETEPQTLPPKSPLNRQPVESAS